MQRLGNILMPAAAASTFGLAQIVARTDLLDGPARGAARALLLALAAYLATGLAGGLAAVVLRERKYALEVRALAILPVPMFAAISLSQNGVTAKALAYAALGLLLYRALLLLLRRVPELPVPALWWRLNAVALGGCLLPLASDALAYGALVIGAGALVASIASARAAPAIANVVLACGVVYVATAEPPVHPDVPPPADATSVLLISIDTLRADHIGAYGYENARTPNLDALAKEGVVFEDAVSHHVFTGPSHLTMLTGLLPENHGALANMAPMDQRRATLADWLRRRGWLTSAFVGGMLVIDRAIGIGHRFHVYGDDLRSHRALPVAVRQVPLLAFLERVLPEATDGTQHFRSAESVTDEAIGWYGRTTGQPFFSFVHYYDAHLPYDPPERFLSPQVRAYRGPATGRWYALSPDTKARIVRDPASLRYMSDLYDAEIAYVDEQIGRLVDAARAAAPGPLMIIVTADHGESFGEHGIYFARCLYDPTLHVPLIVVPAEDKGTDRVPAQVKLADLAPSVLEATGVTVEEELDGKSLLPLVRGSTTAPTGPAFSMLGKMPYQPSRPEFSVRTGGHKLIRRGDGWVSDEIWAEAADELFDLEADPKELTNLQGERPELSTQLETMLAPHMPVPDDRPYDLSEAEMDRLRSLGYVD